MNILGGADGAGYCRYGNVAGKVPTGERQALWTPTAHLPGTEGKMAVMAQRLLDGVPVHHPLDARWEEAGGCLSEARNLPNDDPGK